MSVKLYPYQAQLVEKAYSILEKEKLAYIAAEERTGKTYVSLALVQKMFSSAILCEDINLLVVTKKAAIKGWEDSVKNFKGINATIINYQSVHKVTGYFSIAIIDEAHANLSGYPKPSTTAKTLQSIVYELPIIFLSATPCAQSYSMIFHQLNISQYSPFDRYKSFYTWFKDYGIPRLIRGAGGRQIVQYDEIKDELIQPIFAKYFCFLKRSESGEFEVEPEDEKVYVVPTAETLGYIRKIKKDKKIENIFADTISKEMHLLHMIEGGVLKDNEGKTFDSYADEKIRWIKDRYGDIKSIVIFYEYIAEGEYLKKHFKYANILQGTTFAEGVDLSHLDCAIVYSMNFSVSKYIQRRCRLCHPKRKTPIKVYYLLFKDELSDKLYDCVAEKRRNFTETIYAKEY